jgi:hypothetical protein
MQVFPAGRRPVSFRLLCGNKTNSAAAAAASQQQQQQQQQQQNLLFPCICTSRHIYYFLLRTLALFTCALGKYLAKSKIKVID